MKNLVEVYNEHKTKPIVEFKRAFDEMIINLEGPNKHPPYNYWTNFTVNDKSYYASLSPMYNINECMIFEIIDGKIDFSESVFCKQNLTIGLESLIICCLDFVSNIIINGGETNE